MILDGCHFAYGDFNSREYGMIFAHCDTSSFVNLMGNVRHTFATNLVNGVKQPDGTILSLTPKQVADILGHSTSQITEMYYVKKDTTRLNGLTDAFSI